MEGGCRTLLLVSVHWGIKPAHHVAPDEQYTIFLEVYLEGLNY